MQRKFRLTKSTDFKRVRRLGKSYAHPLVVLIKHPTKIETTRFGVSAGRSVGNAVRRNRAKRRLRECVRPQIPILQTGWDVILLARKPMAQAKFADIESAVNTLLQRAGLYRNVH